MPRFQFRVYGKPTAPGDAIWNQRLPMNRLGEFEADGTAPFTYGDYLQAVCAFLKGDAWGPLPEDRIDNVCIDIQKHGAFYHPAKVTADGFPDALVINLAVSGPGRALLEKEFACLELLGLRDSAHVIPRVFAVSAVSTQDGRPARLFSGEWFSGYREFHISQDEDGCQQMIVWDDDQGHYYLTPNQIADVYRQAAWILTDFYDPETFKQIHPWRHGAGDFVVKRHDDGTVSLKLITVRGYDAALAASDDSNLAALLQGLLLFLLNLSLWNRLDRIDGVGDVAWSSSLAVAATVSGFFKALEQKPTPEGLPEDLSVCFRAFLSVCGLADLTDVAESLVAAYPDGTPEIPVIRNHLHEHLRELHRALNAENRKTESGTFSALTSC